MALPSLTLPPDFPPFAAGAHQLEPDPIYTRVPRQTGVDRVRRVWVTAPTILVADLELTQVQLEAFNAWHEGPLKAGQEPFSVQVAKVGPGTHWYKAYLLSYTAAHSNDLHKVSMRIRLVGAPDDVGPSDFNLTSEVSVPLLFTAAESYEAALRAEVIVALEFAMTVNESMLSEVRVGLQFDADGASSTHQLIDSEVEVNLEFISAVESPEMAAEVSVALDFAVVSDGLLTAEVSLPLSFDVEAVGYVASPSAVSAMGDSSALVEVLSDGRIRSRVDFDAYIDEGLWYTPLTPGVGSGLWVRADVDAGATPSGATVGTWLSLATSPRTWQLSSVGTSDLTIRVALDPDGLSVVSTVSAALEVT